MQDLKENCRLALVQAAPVMFDKAASLKKALSSSYSPSFSSPAIRSA